MPSSQILDLHPAVLSAANRAAAPVLQPAAYGGEYQLAYIAIPGCGSYHDYSKLRQADALPNVRVLQINLFNPSQPFVENGVRAPGALWSMNSVAEAQNTVENRLLIPVYERRMVLFTPSGSLIVDSNHKPILFDSNDPDFFTKLNRYTQGNLSQNSFQRDHGTERSARRA